MQYIDEAIKTLNSQENINELEESILEKLIKQNKKVAVAMCVDALLGGVDTTSSVVIGVLFCLAKNQDKQEKLREELLRVLPQKDEPLTVENTRNLPYLRAVIKEAIRFYPPASGVIRRTKDDLVLSGYRVPKGSDILMGLMVLNTFEENFVRAKEFIPERWLKNTNDDHCPNAKDGNPFAYIPFGFGPRMCVGKRLAELEIEVLVAKIIRNFKVEWHHADINIKSLMINIPDSDLKFRLTEI